MADTTYVLDLMVTGAALVTVFEDGTGVDTISVLGSYASPVEINLCHSVLGGWTASAGARYFDLRGNPHQLIIYGQVERAIGSLGRDLIHGSEFANFLAGEAILGGVGGADTINGGFGDDTLHGGAGADVLSGEGDNDRLHGNQGRDTIQGGAGRDTVEGGLGADYLDGGGSLGDTLSYAGSAWGVQIALTFGALATGRGGDAEGDQVLGFTALVGSDFRDILADRDKTTLAGRGNDNEFQGGAGRDRLYLGGGQDSGFGGEGDDLIWGEEGDDRLAGGSGNDLLRGGAGSDTLTGGAGADVFEFRRALDSTPASRDVIADFTASAGDRLAITGIDADTTLPGDQDFHLVTGGLTGEPGELFLLPDGSDLLVLADVTGDGVPDFALRLTDCLFVDGSAFVL